MPSWCGAEWSTGTILPLQIKLQFHIHGFLCVFLALYHCETFKIFSETFPENNGHRRAVEEQKVMQFKYFGLHTDPSVACLCGQMFVLISHISII